MLQKHHIKLYFDSSYTTNAFSCKKEQQIVGGNNNVHYDEVPTVLVEFYVG